MAKASASKSSLLVSRWKRLSVYPSGSGLATHTLLPPLRYRGVSHLSIPYPGVTPPAEEHTRSLEDDRHVASAQQSLPEISTTSSSKLQQPPHPNYNNFLIQTTASLLKQPLLQSPRLCWNSKLPLSPHPGYEPCRPRPTLPSAAKKGWERSSEWQAETVMDW